MNNNTATNLIECAKKGIWITMEHDYILITNMTNSHLKNSLKMLVRNDNQLVLDLYLKQLMDESLTRKIITKSYYTRLLLKLIN